MVGGEELDSDGDDLLEQVVCPYGFVLSDGLYGVVVVGFAVFDSIRGVYLAEKYADPSQAFHSLCGKWKQMTVRPGERNCIAASAYLKI
jgi:hypothetical protein